MSWRVIAGALGLAGLAALAVRRLRRPSLPLGPSGEESARREWRCQCGQEYLVTGTDRHRIYWLAEEGHKDPVLGQECVTCGEMLPAEREHRPAQTPPWAPLTLSEEGSRPGAA